LIPWDPSLMAMATMAVRLLTLKTTVQILINSAISHTLGLGAPLTSAGTWAPPCLYPLFLLQKVLRSTCTYQIIFSESFDIAPWLLHSWEG
jgi:hypothetical protein